MVCVEVSQCAIFEQESCFLGLYSLEKDGWEYTRNIQTALPEECQDIAKGPLGFEMSSQTCY